MVILAVQNIVTMPAYNTALHNWEFVYSYPNQCNGLPATTFLYWNCNPNVVTANITSLRNISICAFEINVSRLACS